MLKKFQIAIIALFFFSYGNAAIYRADHYTINNSTVYCLYDWHKCIDESVNAKQRELIVAAAQKFQKMYGKDQVVVIAEDPSDFDSTQAIYNGLDSCKRAMAAIDETDKALWYQGCAIGLTALCKKGGLSCSNIDFRHIQNLCDWGYKGIKSQDAATVFKYVEQEVRRNNIQGFQLSKNPCAIELFDARLYQRIVQNIHKKCIIVVAGGAHIENITQQLRKLGNAQSYGLQDDKQLVTVKDEFEENDCLAVASVFDLQKFFGLRNISTEKPPRVGLGNTSKPSSVQLLPVPQRTVQAHAPAPQVQAPVVRQQPVVSAMPAIPAVPVVPVARAPQQDPQQPRSWAQALWAHMTFKNIGISALCAAVVCFMIKE